MSVPDAKYTKGEFEVSPWACLCFRDTPLNPLLVCRGCLLSHAGRSGRVEARRHLVKPLLLLPTLQVVMKVVQLLPDGHRMKKEVDMALDTVSETMTPMHYHLREIIICTYRQVSPSSSLSPPQCHPGPLHPIPEGAAGLPAASIPAHLVPSYTLPSTILHPTQHPASHPASCLSDAVLHPSRHPSSQPASHPSSGAQPAEGRAGPSCSAPSPEGSSA